MLNFDRHLGGLGSLVILGAISASQLTLSTAIKFAQTSGVMLLSLLLSATAQHANPKFEPRSSQSESTVFIAVAAAIHDMSRVLRVLRDIPC